MHIHFDKDHLDNVKQNHDKWWDGTIGRPLVCITRPEIYPSATDKDITLPSQANCNDFSISPTELIKNWDLYKSDERYEGDAYPHINFAFYGPGILAAMCGGRLDNSSGAVWFYPGEKTELKDIRPHYDPDNKWAKRIKDIYYAGLEYWNGSVIMGMPDLGGVLDVAASLRGTQNLLTDLYDDPEEVLRLINDVRIAWYDAYNDFAEVLKPQGAYSDWCGLLSTEPSYIIQCDFCYMISNTMFRKFVLPTLKNDTEKLSHTIYHLDGIGELKHLDDVLSLEKLNAVQWVAGAEQPPAPEWLDVYKKITAANKKYMLCGSCDDYFSVLEKLHGEPYYNCWVNADEDELAEKLLKTR